MSFPRDSAIRSASFVIRYIIIWMKYNVAWSRANSRGLCVCVCGGVLARRVSHLSAGIPGSVFLRGVPVVWSLHISRIPCYAGLITLASSAAAPRLRLCTDSCWPPSTNILLLLPQSTFPLSSVCTFIHHSLCLCVCVCARPSCGSDPSFHLDKTRSGTEVEVASACL